MFKRLNYHWRQVFSGLGFILFSLGGGLLVVTAFPLIRLVYRRPERRIAATRTVIHNTFRVFVYYLHALRILSFEMRNIEVLAACDGVIVVSNHTTLIDVVVIMSLLPNAQCVVKHQLWNSMFLGGVVRAAGYVRNDEDAEVLIANCLKGIKAGGNLIIFPEGTRTLPGEVRKYQRGFANIAIQADVDIQCLVLSCRPLMLWKGSRWHQVPDTRSHYIIEVVDRVKIDEFRHIESQAMAARRVTEHTQRLITERLANA